MTAFRKKQFVDFESLPKVFNIVMLGDVGVGKTSLVIAAADGAYPTTHKGTLSPD